MWNPNPGEGPWGWAGVLVPHSHRGSERSSVQLPQAPWWITCIPKGSGASFVRRAGRLGASFGCKCTPVPCNACLGRTCLCLLTATLFFLGMPGGVPPPQLQICPPAPPGYPGPGTPAGPYPGYPAVPPGAPGTYPPAPPGGYPCGPPPPGPYPQGQHPHGHPPQGHHAHGHPYPGPPGMPGCPPGHHQKHHKKHKKKHSKHHGGKVRVRGQWTFWNLCCGPLDPLMHTRASSLGSWSSPLPPCGGWSRLRTPQWLFLDMETPVWLINRQA